MRRSSGCAGGHSRRLKCLRTRHAWRPLWHESSSGRGSRVPGRPAADCGLAPTDIISGPGYARGLRRGPGVKATVPRGSLAQSSSPSFSRAVCKRCGSPRFQSVPVSPHQKLQHYGTIHAPGASLRCTDLGRAYLDPVGHDCAGAVLVALQGIEHGVIIPYLRGSCLVYVPTLLGAEWAAGVGTALPALPSRIDGGTIDVTVGAAIGGVWSCLSKCSSLPSAISGPRWWLLTCKTTGPI